MIGEVVELGANLEIRSLAQAHHPVHRKIRVDCSRAAQYMLAAIAERALARLHECRCVKPFGRSTHRYVNAPHTKSSITHKKNYPTSGNDFFSFIGRSVVNYFNSICESLNSIAFFFEFNYSDIR